MPNPSRQVTFQTCQFDNCGPDCGFAAPTDPCKCPCHESPLQADEPLRQMMRRYPDQAYAMVAQMVAVVQVRLDTAERERDELRGDLALYERALGEIAGGTDHSPGVLARRAILDVQAGGRDHA